MSNEHYLDGKRLRSRYRLEGNGPDLVLIHGVSDQLENWQGIVDRLKGRYRILRYDLRGHGQTDKPAGPYSLEDFAEDLAELTAAVGMTRFHLAGYSLGGLVAQRFTLRYPAKVDHLILLSTVAGRNEVEKARVEERLRSVEQGDLGDHFESSIARWFTEDFIRANPELVKSYAMQSKDNDQAGIRAAYRVLCTSDLIAELPAIAAPTLVVTGENDIGSNPRMADNMHRAIPGSRLEILPRLKHSILIEAPDKVSSLISDFIGNRPQRQTG